MQQRWKMNRNWIFSTKSKKLKIGCKNEKGRVQEKLFLMKILTKIDFRAPIFIFQSHSSTQNIKNMVVNNMVPLWWSEIPKYIDSCCIFIEPVRTIWHNTSIELDLSCPEHFFWIHCGPYYVPNDLICIGSFFCIFNIFVDFLDFCSFFSPILTILLIKSSPSPLCNLLS